MRIRGKKSASRPGYGREAIRGIDKIQLIKILIIAGAIVAAILVAVGLVSRGNIESSFLSQAETIKVGIRTDIAGFGEISETGDVQGFDADVAKEVISRVLKTEKPVEFVSLTSEDAGAGIKYGRIDMGIGFLVPGSDRVTGFTTTDPYYTDNVYAAVANPALASLSELNGKTIGILNSIIPLAQANDYLDTLNITATITRYFSFDEAVFVLDAQKIDAFLAPEALLKQYMPAYARISEPVAQIGYAILLPTGQSVVQGAISDAIRSMKRDGTMESLAQKWGLPYEG